MTIPRRLKNLSWAQLEQSHACDRYLVVRAALERHGWSVAPAARQLGTSRGVLQRVIDAHSDLADSVRMRGPGRGRPKSL